eukprot:TRINITY_DN27021_c0_g1_i2.p1 TRINITY_DN27021_c0_g1~~TRINITY_DN27021_c0_g1_i2.p1  ORF type:complete len:364 (+),score=49.61 TRINITY_DN27021_c0_g1_i2:68-1159(+)
MEAEAATAAGWIHPAAEDDSSLAVPSGYPAPPFMDDYVRAFEAESPRGREVVIGARMRRASSEEPFPSPRPPGAEDTDLRHRHSGATTSYTPRQYQAVHTHRMAAEMPPMRMPVMAPIGPSPQETRVAPSRAFCDWLVRLERIQEERLLHEAQQRFCRSGPQACLSEFRSWLSKASSAADKAVLCNMRREQLQTWLLCVRHLIIQRYRLTGEVCSESVLPDEVHARIVDYLGGKHVWGPICSHRARAVAQAAQRSLKRCEAVLRQAALAALIARYVHPAVVQAAEAGCMACYTEIPTDDVALQAIFEVMALEQQQPKEVGSVLVSHLQVDGFQVEPKYHDPEYGLWRGFWVEKCNRIRLVVCW